MHVFPGAFCVLARSSVALVRPSGISFRLLVENFSSLTKFDFFLGSRPTASTTRLVATYVVFYLMPAVELFLTDTIFPFIGFYARFFCESAGGGSISSTCVLRRRFHCIGPNPIRSFAFLRVCTVQLGTAQTNAHLTVCDRHIPVSTKNRIIISPGVQPVLLVLGLVVPPTRRQQVFSVCSCLRLKF